MQLVQLVRFDVSSTPQAEIAQDGRDVEASMDEVEAEAEAYF